MSAAGRRTRGGPGSDNPRSVDFPAHRPRADAGACREAAAGRRRHVPVGARRRATSRRSLCARPNRCSSARTPPSSFGRHRTALPRRCGVGRGLGDRGGRSRRPPRGEAPSRGLRRSGGPDHLVDVDLPGNHESAGKRKSGRTGHGNKWLRAALTEAAKTAGRTRHTYLSAQYRHLARRIGRNKATFAVAHSILTIMYVLLRDGGTYRDLGPTYRDERARDAIRRNLVKRLQRLDFDVTVTDQRVA